MDLSNFFMPDNIAPLIGYAIVAASFFTALITAAFGLGGGLALLAAMSALLPAPAVIPIHGAAQMSANFSRFVFMRRYVNWSIIAWFGGGAVLGALIGGQIAVNVPERALRFAIACFILFTLWGPKIKSFAPGPASFTGTGIIGTVLTMFFGATGPFVATMLSQTSLDRLQLVGTHAAAMVCQHGFKCVAFAALGFAFADWTGLILAMIVASFAGSYIGGKLLHAMPEAQFKQGFKLILSAVALLLLVGALR